MVFEHVPYDFKSWILRLGRLNIKVMEDSGRQAPNHEKQLHAAASLRPDGYVAPGDMIRWMTFAGSTRSGCMDRRSRCWLVSRNNRLGFTAKISIGCGSIRIV